MKQVYAKIPRAPYGVVGLGIVLLGLSGLIAREGLVVSFAVFITGCAALPYAYIDTKRAAVMPFIVGGLLVVLGGVAHFGRAHAWFSFAVAFAGVVSFIYGGLAELPTGRSGAWDQPFKKRAH